MGKIRTFLSLNMESFLKEELKLIQDEVKLSLKDYEIKWENPEKFHITIRFLGDIDESELNTLTNAFATIKTGFDTIKYTTAGIDFFQNAKHPNIIYVNLSEENDNSTGLVQLIDNIIKSIGIIPDKKFVPHITLGRFRRDKRKKITEYINISFEKLKLEFKAFYLMKSILKPHGSEYEVIQEFKFK